MRLRNNTFRGEAELPLPLDATSNATSPLLELDLPPAVHRVARDHEAGWREIARGAAPVGAVLEGIVALLAPTGAAFAVEPPTTASHAIAPSHVLRSAYGEASLVGEVILGDGHVSGDIGFRPYTRAYGQSQKGPLRFRHGSPAPESTILTPQDRAKLNAEPPGTALDRMAKRLGRTTGFEAMAKSKDFFDPDKPAWWGLCAPWSWTAEHPKIGPLVDAPGPSGARGRWFMGEWISRADLGNWAMAVTSPFVEYAAQAPTAISVGEVGPLGLLRAAAVVINEKTGFIADVFNDKANGVKETWNQPFWGVEVDAKPLPSSAQKQLIAMAEQDGWHVAKVKSVTVVGKYAVEVSDDHEGPPASAEKRWNMIVAVDGEGRAVWGKMADDPSLAQLSGLPTHKTDAPPDYIVALPNDILDDALLNRPSPLFDQHPLGKEIRFFLGTVLNNAVSGEERSAFEKAVLALPPGEIPVDKAFALRLAHPHVANAYAPLEWQNAFGARGLAAKDFGALPLALEPH